MPIDIKESVNNTDLKPVVFLRWVMAISQLFVIMASESQFGILLPAKPLLILVAASFAVNIHATVKFKKRLMPERTVLVQIIFDVLQLMGFLYFTGGTDNPFAILLLAPLAMAASLLSLYSLCLLLILSLIGVSVMAFGAVPLAWPDPAPILTAGFSRTSWVALLVTLILLSFIIWRLATEGRRTNEVLKSTHAILERRKRATALGALAAAVHELGSPLGTITIIARELERETHPDDPILDDVKLLRSEAERCKKILTELAQNPAKQITNAQPLRADRLIMEIASPMQEDSKTVAVSIVSDVPENLPLIPRNSNFEYGISNLIGNAVSYAKSNVIVKIEGDVDDMRITITDDGPGFKPEVLKDIGQPYISSRDEKKHHMGLGIFIAINLLEATGATLRFKNVSSGGASVEITWPISALEVINDAE